MFITHFLIFFVQEPNEMLAQLSKVCVVLTKGEGCAAICVAG